MLSVFARLFVSKDLSNGMHPVVLQIGKRKRTIGAAFKEQWDTNKRRIKVRSHPNYALINIRISNELLRIEMLILENKFDLKRDFLDYFDNLNAGLQLKDIAVESPKTYLEVCELYIASLSSGSTMITWENKLAYFHRIAEIGDRRFSEITKAHINKFVKYQENKVRKVNGVEVKGNQKSTINTSLKIIRMASNFAARNKLDTKSEDLHNYKMPKPGRSIKGKLTKNELTNFRSVERTGKIKEMQDMFMLAVYLRGMRIGDVIQIKQSDFKDGRYAYESEKNEKLFNIKLVPEAVEIVNRYLNGGEYLFTFFTWKENPLAEPGNNLRSRARHVQSITAEVNTELKRIAKAAGITKNVSTHIARHTFAKMASDAAGGDLNLSMDLVGHSDLREHQKYILELTRDEELDAAADDIFS